MIRKCLICDERGDEELHKEGKVLHYKILIVDDEVLVLKMIRSYLELEGFYIYTAINAKEALKQLKNKVDLILLDVNMPDVNGFELCSNIREKVSCPIIFLTAKSTEADKIRGFMLGGDDYIVKPFGVNELVARIKAHIRRDERFCRKHEIRYLEEMFINYTERTVTVNENSIVFTNKEFEIIKLLSLNPGQVFDRESIYEKVWGLESDGDNSVVKEHIRKIRNKLVPYSNIQFIETVWGVGYKWKKN